MTSQIKKHHNNSHVPVLLDATLQYLAPKRGESYLDLTAGYGGHANVVLSNLGDASRMTLVDRDESAIASLESFREAGARLIHQDFAGASAKLSETGEQFDMILLDLGVSSPHLDNVERGFSFRFDAPLDMRMDQSQVVTAKTVVNTYSEAELVALLKEYGEEPRAHRIAQAIVAARPIETTTELAAVVEKLYGRKGKIHPATRTFQAIRIEVNQELSQLSQTLQYLPGLLKPGGRVAIISFHSLEDRIVKRFFAAEAQSGYEAQLSILTKKPIRGDIEDVFNPRARSAKLRVAVKINTK